MKQGKIELELRLALPTTIDTPQSIAMQHTRLFSKWQKRKALSVTSSRSVTDYGGLLGNVVGLLELARRTSARAVNSVMTATYWEIGRQIVEVEQQGSPQAEYGDELIKRLAADLAARFGRGFAVRNVYQMRAFHLAYRNILQTVSAKLTGPKSAVSSRKLQTVSAKLRTTPRSAISLTKSLSAYFLLPWSHYVSLLSVKDDNARQFYEKEALRGGWSVRQLDRQISSQFYERTLLSKNKSAMLKKGAKSQPTDFITAEEEFKDPLVLEFLDLKDG